jgi:hypothetical protein
MRILRDRILPLGALTLAAALGAQPPSIDAAKAARFFREAEWASDDDGSRLWGRPLYGPMLLFDPATGDAVANRRDAEGALAAADGVFRGRMPKDFAGANTALEWNGVHWTVLLWPLPAGTFDRVRLMLHESWHRVQGDLGLPSVPAKNAHLAGRDGRIWLILEYRALARALPAWGKERKAALEDALAFRAHRRSLFPGAGREEDRMELHEGLAEYTGVAAAGLGNSGARYFMAGRLKLAELKPALSYAFAYETGPAYGLMLDMQSETWRRELDPAASLSGRLAALNGIAADAPTADDARARAAKYGGEALIEAETRRDEERKAAEARYRETLVDGPTLRLPLAQKSYTFDPNAVIPLAGAGTVYVGCKFIDDWGVLTVSGAALADVNLAAVVVPAPASPDDASGPGWTLELDAGWKLAPGARAGDYAVVRR